jgi:hypothetical protein
MAVDDPNTADIMSIDLSGVIMLNSFDHLTERFAHAYTLQIKTNRSNREN